MDRDVMRKRERAFATSVRASAGKPSEGRQGGAAMAVLTTQQKQERDRVIAHAVADGKFSATRAHVWRQAWDAHPAQTKRTISQLVPRAPLVKAEAEKRGEQVRAGLAAAGIEPRSAATATAAGTAPGLRAQVDRGLAAAGVKTTKSNHDPKGS